MIWFVIWFVIWAIVHSVTAAPPTKSAFDRKFGRRAYLGLYRLIYNVISVVTFLPILFLLATQIRYVEIWTIPTPWRYITMGVQILALAGLAISLLQTDVWSFVGLRQAARFWRGARDPSVPDQLITAGTYRWVRHPLYFFSLLFLWLNPSMTLATLLFNVLATLYFWVGSIYEERRLLAAFGDDYEAYKAAVPRMLPIRVNNRNLG